MSSRMELNDISPKHDKSIIEIYENKNSIKANKIGTLNYILDKDKMYITKKPKSNRPDKTGLFDEILTRDKNGILEEDLIIDGNLTVNNFTANGDCTNKKFKTITIERPLIEVNANEKENGIGLKRAGLNINRGLSGSANIFYDEIINGFSFSLDENMNNESFSHTEILQKKDRLIPTEDPQVFNLPIAVSKYDISLLFINSIKILEEKEYEIDYEKQTVKILEKINKNTELSILNFKVKQFDTLGQEITDSNSYLEKCIYSTSVNNKNQKDLIIDLKPANNKEQEHIENIDGTVILAFLNGAFLNPDFYEINDNDGNRATFSFARDVDGELVHIDDNSQLYLVAFCPRYSERENRIIMTPDKNKTSTPEVKKFIIDKVQDEYSMPITIEKENAAIIFVNSILLDTNSYSIDKNILRLHNTSLNVGSVIEVVKIDAFTTSPSLDTISYLMTKKDFKELMTISEDEILTVKTGHLEDLLVTNNADITNLTARQSEGNDFAIDSIGATRIRGRLDVDRMSKFNDYVDFKKKVTTHDKVKHEKYVLHGKPNLYINDNLEKDDGGIIFERSIAPHAIIKWKENVKRWFAGIEGTEKPIVTMDMLELMLERFMNLAGLDTDVHTSIVIDEQNVETLERDYPREEARFTTFSSSMDKVLLVFLNGRYVSEDEYDYRGNQVFFNGGLDKGSKITFIEIRLNQVSLTGYPIKEEISLTKKYIKVNSKKDNQNEFELPYSIDPFDNANLIFLNGILLTKDLYSINGNILSLNFDTKIPSELVIMSLSASKGATVSKVELVDRFIKLEANKKSQKDFILPVEIKEEKDNFLLFCNTTFIPREFYEIKDRTLTLLNIEENFVNPPTELIITEFLPIIKRCSQTGGSTNDLNARSYSMDIKANQKYIKLPFIVNKSNPSLMLFLDGKILSKDEYNVLENIIELIDIRPKNTNFLIMDFAKDSTGLTGDLSGKGTRIYEIKTIEEEIILPFNVIGSEDTNLVFIDGVLINSNEYSIKENRLKLLGDNPIKEKSIKLINFSNLRNIEYNKSNKPGFDKKIINQDQKSKVWNIKHNLNTYPNIVIIDDKKQVIQKVRTTYDSLNSLTLEFEDDVKGKVILS